MVKLIWLEMYAFLIGFTIVRDLGRVGHGRC